MAAAAFDMRRAFPVESMEPDWTANSVLLGANVEAGPHFKVSEVANFFFAKPAHWIRWKERQGDLRLNGRQVAQRHKKEGGARSYTLRDVELMAHALCENGAIDVIHLKNVLRIVYIEAHIWGYLPKE